MPMADVTICIPAWQAEPFIERTLNCARAQTHDKIRILVSIDHSVDGTEAICRTQAQLDPRIDVMVQKERLGWSENSNLLLDQVDTEFCFLYFHDDIIEPTYTERLRQQLLDHPDAQSAHCDIERFGNQQGLHPGVDVEGTTIERLIKLLVGPVAGAPLRSMFRSELIAKGLRFPLIGGDSFWRCQPFLMKLIVAGPTRRVPEILYRRWIRDGGITRTWNPTEQDALAEGQHESARLCLDLIRSLHLPRAVEEVVKFCQYVSVMTQTRKIEMRLESDRLIEPEVICESFGTVQLPRNTSSIDPKLLDLILRAYGTLLFIEAKHAWQHGRQQSALLGLATAFSLNPSLPGAPATLVSILDAAGQTQGAAAVRQRARVVRQRARVMKALKDRPAN
jgi:glycosyltransferase involved in cell wall biosynthesis